MNVATQDNETISLYSFYNFIQNGIHTLLKVYLISSYIAFWHVYLTKYTSQCHCVTKVFSSHS